MSKYHLRLRDAYHLLIMQFNNIDSFLTFDNDFKLVFAAKILNPVVS
jgi:predicted nucleic acid-binding protein